MGETGSRLETPKTAAVQTQSLVPGNQEEPVADELQRQTLQNARLLSGGQSFVLFRSSIHWMRPICAVKGNLLFSKSADLNRNI